MSAGVRVAFLGPPGTFSQQAAFSHFGKDFEPVVCPTIEDVFGAIEEDRADFGVVPVENSTEGVVNNTQDCMVDTSACIVGEVIVSIEHHLLVSPSSDPGALKQIASHRQSLAQCRKWLRENYPQLPVIECSSNAEAARMAAEQPDTAAIAGALAAETYHLKRAAEGIQDQAHNRTRFLVFGTARTEPSGHDKTTVLIYTANRPGALFHVLEPFEKLQISLTKIDSRPAKKAAWEYVFFIDFEGHVRDERIAELFRRLEGCTEEVKILGSYPAFRAD